MRNSLTSPARSTTVRLFDECAEHGGPDFLTGVMVELCRDNRDGTHTLVESVWGARRCDPLNDAPTSPIVCSRKLTITVFTDTEAVDESQISSISSTETFSCEGADLQQCHAAAVEHSDREYRRWSACATSDAAEM